MVLTDRQAEVLSWIEARTRQLGGRAPSITEAAAHFGITKPSMWASYRSLRRSGHLHQEKLGGPYTPTGARCQSCGAAL